MPVAIITGASKGLGRALGAALAERGWDLVLDARTAEVLDGTAVALSAYGTRVEALPGDMDTDLYAAAVPDDGDPRPAPATVVPAFLRLLDARPASGRYAAPALLEVTR